MTTWFKSGSTEFFPATQRCYILACGVSVPTRALTVLYTTELGMGGGRRQSRRRETGNKRDNVSAGDKNKS